QRTWRPADPWKLGLFEMDAEPLVGATVGNVLTEGFLGGTIRIGHALERTALPMRVRPSLAGSGSYDQTTGIGWYFFLGATERAVGYNVFLQGPTPYVSHITHKPFVTDAQAGAVLRINRLQVSYTYVARTKEFEQQVGDDRFGALSFSWHL